MSDVPRLPCFTINEAAQYLRISRADELTRQRRTDFFRRGVGNAARMRPKQISTSQLCRKQIRTPCGRSLTNC